MFHEPFGPRGAEDERDDFWTDLSEVTDTAYREDPAAPQAGRRLNSTSRRQSAGDVMLPDIGQHLEEDTASHQDPLGSWTGVPDTNAFETPTQDADDL
ncbi:hypothetical protein [uncultured Subdoligranulum sp.]|uniref:hypothetical protein n=1 Tax=uncultured Subdoligranulum sp. TaxID=512298 RepID=UPI0026042FCA|nr:hypothetical protein [uncultured Subdoligranulum sp.]